MWCNSVAIWVNIALDNGLAPNGRQAIIVGNQWCPVDIKAYAYGNIYTIKLEVYLLWLLLLISFNQLNKSPAFFRQNLSDFNSLRSGEAKMQIYLSHIGSFGYQSWCLNMTLV